MTEPVAPGGYQPVNSWTRSTASHRLQSVTVGNNNASTETPPTEGDVPPAIKSCQTQENTVVVDGPSQVVEKSSGDGIDTVSPEETSAGETSETTSDGGSEVITTLQYSRSHFTDDMSSTALIPAPFRGLASEDAEAWWREVEHWCSFRKLDDEERAGLVPLLLKDGAKHWYT